MLVVGYPVNYETICKFFNVSSDADIDVEKLVKEKSELEFHSTDKQISEFLSQILNIK